MNKLLIIVLFAILWAKLKASNFPLFSKGQYGKMKITLEFDGVENNQNRCDPGCISYCAKTYPHDPDGMYQCLRSCGCNEEQETEDMVKFDKFDESQKDDTSFLEIIAPHKQRCCLVCMSKCMDHCPSKKIKPKCKKICKKLCCRSFDE